MAWLGLPDGEKSLMLFSCFDTIQADGRIDGHLAAGGIVHAMHSIAG